MLYVVVSASRTSREIPTRPRPKPPSLPFQPCPHHPGTLKMITSDLPGGHARGATDVRSHHWLTNNIDVILETHCIDAFSFYWHGWLQNPFIGWRIVTLSLVCSQLPIGSSSNDIQLLLVTSSCKGTDMDKKRCSLQRPRAQKVSALQRFLENTHLGMLSTEMAKPIAPNKMQRATKPTISTGSGKPGTNCASAVPACLSQRPAPTEGGIQAKLNVYACEASILISIQWSIMRC